MKELHKRKLSCSFHKRNKWAVDLCIKQFTKYLDQIFPTVGIRVSQISVSVRVYRFLTR